MKFVNWLNLQPSQDELDELCGEFHNPVPAREFRQKLIEITVRGFPWEERSDLIDGYHPSQSYQKDQWIALPIHDIENLHPLVWQIVRVAKTETAENPMQGAFEVLTFDIYGQQAQLACGIPNAPFPDSSLSNLSSEDLHWLAVWVEETYRENIKSAVTRLQETGKLQGKFTTGNYIPEQKAHEVAASKNDDTSMPPSAKLPFYRRIWKSLLMLFRKFFGGKP